MMLVNATGGARYWNQRIGAGGAWRCEKSGALRRPPGEDLAAMRQGLGQPAGSVPALWRFYTCEIDDRAARHGGEVSYEQAAEHAALSLFGLHQQGQQSPMHRPGESIGRALKKLRDTERFSATALDSRLAAAVTTTSVSAFVYRLRGLIEQLRTESLPIDYDLLMADIQAWHYASDRHRVRRSWGLAYYVWEQDTTTPGAGDADEATPNTSS